MRKKLLIMFGLVLVMAFALMPVAFAEGPDDVQPTYEATAQVVDSVPNAQDTIVPSSTVVVNVDTPTATLDEIAVEKVSDDAATKISSETSSEEKVIAAGTITAKDENDQSLTNIDDITSSDKENPITVNVTTEKVDTSSNGIALYEISTDGSIISDRSNEITSITQSETTTLVSYMTDSLYNFLLKTYGKYSSSADKSLTYTPGVEEVVDEEIVTTEGVKEKYSIEETIGNQIISIEIVGEEKDNSADPMNLSACFTTPTDLYIKYDMVDEAYLKYSDYVFACQVSMKKGNETLTSLDSKYTATIKLSTDKLAQNKVLKIYNADGEEVNSDFSSDDSGNKLVLTKTVSNFSDIFNYIIVAENTSEATLSDKAVEDGENPVKEGTANGYSVSIENTTIATKATLNTYGKEYRDYRLKNIIDSADSLLIGGYLKLTDSNGKEATYAGNTVTLKLSADYFNAANKSALLYEIDSNGDLVDKTEELKSITFNGTTSSEITIESYKTYDFLVVLKQKETQPFTVNGETVSDLSADYSTANGTFVYKAATNEIILNNYESNNSLTFQGNTRVRLIGSSTIHTDGVAVSVSNGKISFVGDGKLRLVTSVETTAGINAVIDDDCYTTNGNASVIKKDEIGFIIAPDYYFFDISLGGDVTPYSDGDEKLFITDGIKLSTNSGVDTPDADLQALLPTGLYIGGDVSYYQFTTKSVGTELNFNYIFWSCEFDQSPTYNDAFGLFVSVNGGAFENLAKFKDSDGNLQTITMNNLRNVAGVTNGQLSGASAKNYSTFVYEGGGEGYTYLLTGTKAVNKGDTITIKFVTADVTDQSYDSYVLIEKDSFNFQKKISFDDDNGTVGKLILTTTSPFPSEQELNGLGLNYSTKKGYNFAGWYDTNTNNMLKEVGNDAVENIDWETITTVKAKWIPKEIEVTVNVEGNEKTKFNWTYGTDLEECLVKYTEKKRGYETLWETFPKDTDGEYFDTPFAVNQYFEAKTYTVTIDYLNGNKASFKVKFGTSMKDLAAMIGTPTHIFTGYYAAIGGMYWDNTGKNVRIMDIDSDMTFYPQFMYVNSYAYAKHVSFSPASGEDFVMKYKFNNILSCVTEETLDQVKVLLDGIELDKSKLTIVLDAFGNIQVIIDSEYMKTLAPGDYVLSTYLLNTKFNTTITIQ